LIQSMFEIIEKDISDREVEKVTRIVLEMGTLSNAEPLLLEQCFEVLKKDTIFEDARFEIDQVETEVKCTACGVVFHPDDFPFMCPVCGGMQAEIKKGDDIILSKLELEVVDDGRN